MKIIKIILAIALFVFAIALGRENQDVVQFNYLIAQGEFQLSVLLGIIFAIGFFIAFLFFATWYFKAHLEIARLRRQLKKSNAEASKVEVIESSKKKTNKSEKAKPVEIESDSKEAPALASPETDANSTKG